MLYVYQKKENRYQNRISLHTSEKSIHYQRLAIKTDGRGIKASGLTPMANPGSLYDTAYGQSPKHHQEQYLSSEPV